ncbi:MAG: NFACT family protein [Lachnospiraceae bacterium]
MAFDGITIAGIVSELRNTIVEGRIYKIAQPEEDELLLTIKNRGSQYRLLLSADASLPLIYLTQNNKPGPLTAPNFCMLLRKHLQNARIVDIVQPEFERVVEIRLEHLNELGDLCRKKLMVEVMGKHSNIIFTDDQGKIIDSIKHISGMVSSVREVLPGRDYFIPKTQDKKNPLQATTEETKALLKDKGMPCYKVLYSSYTGISPIIAQEVCYRAGVDSDRAAGSLDEAQQKKLAEAFGAVMQEVRREQFSCSIVYENKVPKEYAAVALTLYQTQEKREYESISELLEDYYAQKSAVTRIRQKSVDLRKIVQTALERNVKKYDLQCKQLKDTEKREQYKIYGELLNTYGYGVVQGASSMEALNYYTNEMITIPLDPLYSAGENAKRYFEKYGKLKRTYEALQELTKETKSEIDHLESVATALDIAEKEEDLVQIKEELIESGYIRRKGTVKKAKITSKPFHYISSDGFHIYVGKNNFQNDELTFQFAAGNDWWFHAKGMPGSHVIVKANGETLPDRTYEEAARLAAHFSKGAAQEKIEVDYTEKKNVKKPSGAKPGFVVYYTNYSMMISTDITGITLADS